MQKILKISHLIARRCYGRINLNPSKHVTKNSEIKNIKNMNHDINDKISD